MFTYDPPSNIDDLAGRPTRTGFLDGWHLRIKRDFLDEIGRLPPGNSLFFSETAHAATSSDLPVTWNAFPLSIARDHPNDAVGRWGAADALGSVNRSVGGGAAPAPMPCRLQDEYCEWFAYRDTPTGPIKRFVFTAEAPEYWIELAKHDFAHVLDLYRKYVSPQVTEADLRLAQDINGPGEALQKGSYNPYNVWNTSKGVLHLTHPANTLGAEIDLAARATVPRRDANGKRVTEVRRFACGSNFGDPNRSSDPNIGLGVNLTVLPAASGAAARSITLANPVALYLDRLAPNVLTDENDNPLNDWFKIVRGVAGRGLMAVLEPPPGAAFGLEKVQVLGKPLTHGGQVADHIQMVLYAKTANLAQPTPALSACIAHCCRPAGPKPVDQVNLDQRGESDACSGANAGDPFPELITANLIGAAVVPETVAAPPPIRPAGRQARVDG